MVFEIVSVVVLFVRVTVTTVICALAPILVVVVEMVKVFMMT